MQDFLTILGAARTAFIPVGSAIVGFLHRKEKERERRENEKLKLDKLFVHHMLVTSKLTENIAKKLTKNGIINGDTHESIDYHRKTRHALEDYIQEMGIENTS